MRDQKAKGQYENTSIGQKEQGAVSDPILQNYYYAAQIQVLRTWLNDDIQAKWRSIELSP